MFLHSDKMEFRLAFKSSGICCFRFRRWAGYAGRNNSPVCTLTRWASTGAHGQASHVLLACVCCAFDRFPNATVTGSVTRYWLIMKEFTGNSRLLTRSAMGLLKDLFREFHRLHNGRCPRKITDCLRFIHSHTRSLTSTRSHIGSLLSRTYKAWFIYIT